MDSIRIKGGQPLNGKIHISGAKNASLPLLAASLLTEETLSLGNVPHLVDIVTMSNLLGQLGVDIGLNGIVAGGFAGRAMDLKAANLSGITAPYELVRKMRASFVVLGPLLARMGHAKVSLPGGCAIGARPVNLHLEALERMGAVIEIDKGYVEAHVPAGRLKAIDHTFEKVSVGATENILMAATLADGTSVLRNAALEPEIGDLAAMLVAMGARIEGIGTPVLTVRGATSLGGCEHGVIPDRIEAGTFLCAVAATCGDVLLERVEPEQIRSIIDLLERCGCVFTERQGAEGRHLRIQRECGQKLRAKDLATAPYPGFPTDLQAQVMAVMTQATGISVIRETIFENRFQHAMELERLGANLRIDGGTAIVAGPSALTGCTVMATDLRASATLVIAGLVADGETIVDRIYHLDRGYSGLEEKLRGLGARIERVSGGKV